MSFEQLEGDWVIRPVAKAVDPNDAEAADDDLNWPELEYESLSPRRVGEATVKFEHRGRLKPMPIELDGSWVMTAFWFSINEPTLHQGDLLPDCLIPEFTALLGDAIGDSNTIYTDQADLIVLSQTCDLAHGKLSLAALCPVWTVPAFVTCREASCVNVCARASSSCQVSNGKEIER